MDNTQRFTSRVSHYVRYRPSYPPEILDVLRAECGLTPESVIADIGSGTGLLTQFFARNGNRVFAVEPNEDMRAAGEEELREFTNVSSVNGRGEATTLPAASVDFVTAAQAFHWMNREAAKAEFRRILRPGGWVVLVWNFRKLTETPFLVDLEALINRFGTDYSQVRYENYMRHIQPFYAPNPFKLRRLEYRQVVDFPALCGRLLSASYMPNEGHPDYEAMMEALRELFTRHQRDGLVTLDYDTRIYLGQLAPPNSVKATTGEELL